MGSYLVTIQTMLVQFLLLRRDCKVLLWLKCLAYIYFGWFVLQDAYTAIPYFAGSQNKIGVTVSPLAGKLFVVIGAGGAGKALAYGAKEKGARVVIANRTYGELNLMVYKLHLSWTLYFYILAYYYLFFFHWTKYPFLHVIWLDNDTWFLFFNLFHFKNEQKNLQT